MTSKITIKSPQIVIPVIVSVSLLITSCASSPVVNDPENSDYWYCAPGDNRSWRCAENKESLGLSYYRFWKTTLDPEAEGTDGDESSSVEDEQKFEDSLVVKGAQVFPGEDLSDEVVEVPVGQIVDAVAEVKPEPEPQLQEPLKQIVTQTKPAYTKVLQLAAYHSQEQALTLAELITAGIQVTPSVVQTQVNTQDYYTVVFDQLSSQQDADQLIAELADSFPEIQPWLRSRKGFDSSRND